MSDDIKIGDRVRLKSGGPTMVVEEIDAAYEGGAPRAWCEWFNEKNLPCKKDFALTSVEKVPPPAPGGSLQPKINRP